MTIKHCARVYVHVKFKTSRGLWKISLPMSLSFIYKNVWWLSLNNRPV